MTAEQLVSYAISKVYQKKITFDTEDTKFKIVYLGRSDSRHFFVFSLTPVDPIKATNANSIKAIIKVFDDIGFCDLHWRHFNDDEPNVYSYYMTMSDSKMKEI